MKIEHSMQWIAVYQEKTETKITKILKQFEEFENSQATNNIKKAIKLAEQDKLNFLIVIPREIYFDKNKLNEIIPRIVLDIKTGEFHVNGICWSFEPKELQELQGKGVTRRIIYFNRMRIDSTVQGTVKEHYLKYYLIGWQTTIEGKNYQRILKLDVKEKKITVLEKR